MITRAVNLSHPITIIYPVKEHGYYCTATAGYTASHYTANMTTQSSHGSLPASQYSSLELYRVLLIVHGIGYALWFYIFSSTSLTSPLAPLLILALCQVLNRLIFYEINNRYGGSQTSTVCAWLSISTDIAQHTLTGWVLALLAISEMDRWTSVRSLFTLFSITACSGLLEWTASIYATDPVLTGVAVGSVGIGIMLGGLITIGKIRSDMYRSKRAVQIPPCFWIFSSGLALGALLLIIDAIVLVSAAHSRNFAVEFWQWRWIMIDESNNLMFGLLADFVAAMCYLISRGG